MLELPKKGRSKNFFSNKFGFHIFSVSNWLGFSIFPLTKIKFSFLPLYTYYLEFILRIFKTFRPLKKKFRLERFFLQKSSYWFVEIYF